MTQNVAEPSQNGKTIASCQTSYLIGAKAPAPNRIKGLKCRECGAHQEIAPKNVCEFCFGPLEVEYDYDVIKAAISHESIARGPASIWRYADLLPVEGVPHVNLEAGFTPLVHAENLGRVTRHR